MKKTIEINDYDYKKMIKEFEIDERFQNNNKKLKKKWAEENRKYQTSIEHMKEFREQSYRQKKSDLLKKLNKKESLWITSLENNKLDKKKEKERIIANDGKRKKCERKRRKIFGRARKT